MITNQPMIASTCALILAAGLSAQDKGYVAVSLGPSVPLGDFASDSFSNQKAGLARTGVFLEATGGYRVVPAFGIMGTIRAAANPVDAQALADALASSVGGTVRVEARPWSTSSVMLGIFTAIDLSDNIVLEARLQGGLGVASSPEVSVDASGSKVKETSASGAAFTLALGGGLRFGLSERLCLLTSIDYQAMEPEFTGGESTGSMGTQKLQAFKQPMSWLSIGIGLGVRLAGKDS